MAVGFGVQGFRGLDLGFRVEALTCRDFFGEIRGGHKRLILVDVDALRVLGLFHVSSRRCIRAILFPTHKP